MSLRKRIANSGWLNRAVTGLFAGYIRLAHRTTRWNIEGHDDLAAALEADTSVILVLWHQRIAYSPYMFDFSRGRILSLTSNARAGRLAGQIQARFGFETVPFNSKTANLAASRQVVRMIRDGYSIGIAADGPRGPARVAKTVPIEWARMTGRPVFLVTFSTNRFWQWSTWDSMVFPCPFARGRMVFERWSTPVPRRLDADGTEALRAALETDLTRLTEQTDARMRDR